jgi:hypothetical protein
MLRRAFRHRGRCALETLHASGCNSIFSLVMNALLSDLPKRAQVMAYKITKEQQRAMDLYSGMLEEVKMRVSAIEFAISGLLNYHPVIIREFAYLQLRMICELIALGCLLSHGDLPGAQSKALRKAWNPDDIFKALENLHSDFYPHPFEQISHRQYEELRHVQSGFLTKAELLELNAKCGDIVHRGSLKKMLIGPLAVRPGELDDVVMWINKIRVLMKSHRIGLKGGQSHLICTWAARLMNGHAQVAFSHAELPPEDVLESEAQNNPAT